MEKQKFPKISRSQTAEAANIDEKAIVSSLSNSKDSLVESGEFPKIPRSQTAEAANIDEKA